MSYLGLGDSMLVGPVVFPPRYQGVQVIERGPHGMRFAQDPIRTPDGRYVWWSEQMAQSGEAAASWLPQQKVVGVMGLGQVSLPRWLVPVMLLGVLYAVVK